ncbi:MAG TPA: endonuclease/exonuclease/phosphatase family protein [Terriglobales bacterium]|nr:endonuclease/exonuclease/phosphatase family protein [Terriglobales bacterium]
MASTIRLVTYNVHKCRGWDRRVSPERIAHVLAPLDADCIALQEVVDGTPVGRTNQAEVIRQALGESYKLIFGRTRDLRGADYGNATLTRLPVRRSENYNISWRRREPRGCVRTDLCLKNGALLHVFNVHLGTSFFERRAQGPLLLTDQVLNHAAHTGPRVILGDFNEWTRGVTSKLMAEQFQKIHIRRYQRKRGSFPGPVPVLELDHIYYDSALELVHFEMLRTRLALMASDHLPMLAEFRIGKKLNSR